MQLEQTKLYKVIPEKDIDNGIGIWLRMWHFPLKNIQNSLITN